MEMIERIIKGTKSHMSYSEDGERTLIWIINGTPYNEVIVGEYGNFVLSHINNLSVAKRFKNSAISICGTVISIPDNNVIIIRNDYGTDIAIRVDRCISHKRIENVSTHFVENAFSTIKFITNNSIVIYDKINNCIKDIADKCTDYMANNANVCAFRL